MSLSSLKLSLLLITISLSLTIVECCRTGVELIADNNWWKTTTYYQIYPRSFKDSDGDGVGDLNGINSKLEHLHEAGVEAIWISPIYPSPMADFGYDISNFIDIDPAFGTLDDFDNLLRRANEFGIRVILDFVPNHSSDEHEWFKKSIARIEPYTNYYVWMDGKDIDETGELVPPNNWISSFQGSAWEWNEARGQYYLHQFAKGQPDLNYNDENLRREMEDVLKFWIERGVSGFRIDAINVLFEDPSFADEPPSGNTNVPEGYYDSLNHTLTRDLNETYEVLKSWRDLLDAYSASNNKDRIVLMTEGYASTDLVMKYFHYGSDIPFNFQFITDTNGESTAGELKSVIDQWTDDIPDGYVPNWVVGNHDQRRVASRYGVDRADQMTIVCMILPGISVSYNGDEIGMLDGDVSWEDTVDPAACNTDEEYYEIYTRDPERTPFQWDNTTSGGFSTNSTTWLPVNPNYVTLNLAAEKASDHSHFHVYKSMTALRKLPILKRGETSVEVFEDENVLLIKRSVTGATPIIVLVNCGSTTVNLNVSNRVNIPDTMTIYTASVSANINPGVVVETESVALPPSATLVLTSQRLYEIVN